MSERPTLTTLWITEGPDGARIRKAQSTSQQLLEDPFNYGGSAGEGGLQRPLYDMDQLVAMLETNTLHSRCVQQKAADVVGRGFTLRPLEEGKGAPEEEARWFEFLDNVEEDVRGDESFKERIQQAHHDYESVGWAVLEFSRRADGVLDGMWQIPAHTMRAHKDGRRYAQKRAGKVVWFKRFGLDGTVDRTSGAWSDKTATGDFAGNEVLVVRNYTPRSSFYGLPDHVPAFSAIAGWRAQAEFNVRFFDNNAVPSYVVIVEGADVAPEFEEKILEHFRAIKGDPHRTIVIPVPGVAGDEAAQVKVRFERLSVDVKDASFRLYKQDNALEICIAHGVPPYRVGWPIVGSLGGSTAEEMTQIYNDSVVQPRQETWEQRLNRTILGAKGLAIATFSLKANELDTRNEARDVAKAQALYDMNALIPDEARNFFGLDPMKDKRGQQTKAESTPPPAPAFGGGLTAIDAAALGKRFAGEVSELARIRKQLEVLAA